MKTRVENYVIEPGNGTRYKLMFADIVGIDGVSAEMPYVLVVRWGGVKNWAYPYMPGNYVAPRYLEEKSGMGKADCEALAPILTQLLAKW